MPTYSMNREPVAISHRLRTRQEFNGTLHEGHRQQSRGSQIDSFRFRKTNVGRLAEVEGGAVVVERHRQRQRPRRNGNFLA